ncbi:MAG: NAAT family transporter [Proteobacteria bacterium]|nr:MAG: NAAT family transporter [Pseudomonadota bacterium]
MPRAGSFVLAIPPLPLGMVNELLIAFSTLFAIVDPVTLAGPFLGMTANESASSRRNTAIRAVALSFTILVGCAFAGQKLLDLLGITLPAFQIAGGILLFVVAFDMIYGRPHLNQQTEAEQQEGATKEDVAVFPLAIPLLAGPGAIASVLILSNRAAGITSMAMLLLAITLTMGLSLLVLLISSRIQKFFGQIGINTLSRLMGIVLSALAVQFVVSAVQQLLKA